MSDSEHSAHCTLWHALDAEHVTETQQGKPEELLWIHIRVCLTVWFNSGGGHGLQMLARGTGDDRTGVQRW